MPQALCNVPPLALAALLITARALCERFGLKHPTVTEILSATSATKSRAYQLSAQLNELLQTLVKPVGRPAAEQVAPSQERPPGHDEVQTAVLRYIMQHPGCASRRKQRQHYSRGFVHFIIGLHEQHPNITIEQLAALSEVPLGTLKPWLARPKQAAQSPADEQTPVTVGGADPPDAAELNVANIQNVLEAYRNWDGSFVDFAAHVREHLRIDMGRQRISAILNAAGIRLPRKRPGRSADELALRGAFETFFPGAQWVGDGKLVEVVLDGEVLSFNLQLNVDAYSGAFMGVSIRDNEDSVGVVDSFKDGVATAGKAPLALLLDNKPCNHTPEVDETLKPSDTLRIRATPARPQNKAHVEGAFGLFSQHAPSIVLNTDGDSRSVARQVLELTVMTWARTTNWLPRADRNGQSRIELYNDQPSDEQIAQARQALEQRQRQQEQARATLQARQRPEVHALLDKRFEELELLDPERHIRIAIARYPLNAIVDGIAIFTGKRAARTLPEGADARYLLGIVRNLADKTEADCIATALLDERLKARDALLEVLKAQRATACDPARSNVDAITDCLQRALESERLIDRLFWRSTLADCIEQRSVDGEQRRSLFHAAARRINTSFGIPAQQRQQLLVFLANRLFPID